MDLLFMGTPGFAVPSLEALFRAGHHILLVVTQPDRSKGRSRKPTPPPVKEAALELGLHLIQPQKPSAKEVMEALGGERPGAVAVVAYGAILKKDMLELPRMGCINAHASLLPRYRGAAPIQWAIACGEEVTGVTTMLMDQGMDTGDILMQREVRINEDDTGGSLSHKLAPMAADLLVETVGGLEQGRLKPVAQDHDRATCAPMLEKQHARIDWTMRATDIERRVRAFDPWPGTFTEWRGKKLKVTKAMPGPGEEGRPGEVLSCGKEGILVACGEEALLVTQLQPEGKRRMSASEFLAGHELSPGEALGGNR